VGVWLLGGLWIAFSLYWGRQARSAAATLRRAADPLYGLNILATVVGLVLLLTEFGDLGPFAYRILPNNPLTFWAGFALTVLGLALAVWARRALGPFWASRIEIKNGHRLIQNGPYRLVRHPIYSGIVLAAFGSMIADCDTGGVTGFALIAASFILKLRREERFVAAAFGDQWRAWRERTWALVPFLF